MILKCNNCGDYISPAAAYQNEKYGYGFRVHNKCNQGSADPKWRCTVCETVRAAKKEEVR